MASGDIQAEQRVEVARVASQIFGTAVAAEHVIFETLVRATATPNVDAVGLGAAVRARGEAESDGPVLKAGFEALRADPAGLLGGGHARYHRGAFDRKP